MDQEVLWSAWAAECMTSVDTKHFDIGSLAIRLQHLKWKGSPSKSLPRCSSGHTQSSLLYKQHLRNCQGSRVEAELRSVPARSKALPLCLLLHWAPRRDWLQCWEPPRSSPWIKDLLAWGPGSAGNLLPAASSTLDMKSKAASPTLPSQVLGCLKPGCCKCSSADCFQAFRTILYNCTVQ